MRIMVGQVIEIRMSGRQQIIREGMCVQSIVNNVGEV